MKTLAELQRDVEGLEQAWRGAVQAGESDRAKDIDWELLAAKTRVLQRIAGLALQLNRATATTVGQVLRGTANAKTIQDARVWVDETYAGSGVPPEPMKMVAGVPDEAALQVLRTDLTFLAAVAELLA